MKQYAELKLVHDLLASSVLSENNRNENAGVLTGSVYRHCCRMHFHKCVHGNPKTSSPEGMSIVA